MNRLSAHHARRLSGTPLGVICFFLISSEAIVGIVATQVQGTVQLLLTIFVMLFILVIAAAFFLILWKRPYVFYSPREFSETCDVKRYVETISRQIRVESDCPNHGPKMALHAMCEPKVGNPSDTNSLPQ